MVTHFAMLRIGEPEPLMRLITFSIWSRYSNCFSGWRTGSMVSW